MNQQDQLAALNPEVRAEQQRIVDAIVRTVRDNYGRDYAQYANGVLATVLPGYAVDGKFFDSEGTSIAGKTIKARTFSEDGYDRDGFDRDGRNAAGLDINGFDIDGFSRSYDKAEVTAAEAAPYNPTTYAG